jgi:hypothetical protein
MPKAGGTFTGNITVPSINGGPLAGFRNAIINGNFDIWQRGTSFASPASGTYLADRWLHGFDGTGATRTLSRQSFVLGQTDVPNEPTYFFRYNQSVAGTGATITNFQQRIEGVRTFAGQQVTISFYAKAASAITLPAIVIQQIFGTGGSPSSIVNTTVASSVAIGTNWIKYSYTGTFSSISGKTLGSDNNDCIQLTIRLPLNTTFTFDIAQVQLEAGPVATPFERRPIGTELALCQRYYQRFGSVYVITYALAGAPYKQSLSFLAQMRGTPTAITTSVSYVNASAISTVVNPGLIQVGAQASTTNASSVAFDLALDAEL